MHSSLGVLIVGFIVLVYLFKTYLLPRERVALA